MTAVAGEVEFGDGAAAVVEVANKNPSRRGHGERRRTEGGRARRRWGTEAAKVGHGGGGGDGAEYWQPAGV